MAITTLVWPAAETPTLRARMKPLDALDRAAGAATNSLNFAVLDDVDAACVRRAGKAPGHRIVPRRAAAPLQGAAHNGIAHRGDVQRRAEFLALLGGQPFIVDAVKPVGMDVALEADDVVMVMRQHQDAARGIHHVVIEVGGQAFPQLHRVVVKRGALVEQIVRAHDGGVAPGIAAAQPAALDHRDIGDAVFLGEIIGAGEAVAAGADDDHVIFGLGFRRAPLRLPALVAAKRAAEQLEAGEFLQGIKPPGTAACPACRHAGPDRV